MEEVRFQLDLSPSGSKGSNNLFVFWRRYSICSRERMKPELMMVGEGRG